MDAREDTEMAAKEVFKAAEIGDTSVFKSFSDDKLSKFLSLRNDDGRSLLHVAASSTHSEVVEILAEADSTKKVINSKDEEGWAPLHSASSIGHLDTVSTLLNKGADVNLKNDGGRTALHYAASKGWVKIAEMLLAHGANINAKDKRRTKTDELRAKTEDRPAKTGDDISFTWYNFTFSVFSSISFLWSCHKTHYRIIFHCFCISRVRILCFILRMKFIYRFCFFSR
ncbi:hypothetical protein BVRB_6g137170 isoform B [Beta vulgaris subsp. vulgaris]|nr:hypothetical protein BVRB_6g137170 isoform B [Beta vulgaris subsp. vulgaris]